MKAFGKWPFDCSIDHANTAFLSISDEVTVGLCLLKALMPHHFGQQLEGEFKQAMIQLLIIKVFGSDSQHSLHYLAADRV